MPLKEHAKNEDPPTSFIAFLLKRYYKEMKMKDTQAHSQDLE